MHVSGGSVLNHKTRSLGRRHVILGVTPRSRTDVMHRASDYVRTARKYARCVAECKITVDEYAENLLDSCALLSECDEVTTQAVTESVPELARDRLFQEIQKVLAPSYQYPELHFGGPGPSPEDREKLRVLYENRIRSFARALGEALRSA
jgi:hypothetical protein